MSERVCKALFIFITTIYLARTLDKDDFGAFSYARSMLMFLGSFVYLGMSGLLVREFVTHKDRENVIFGTSLFLKLIFALIGYVLILGWSFFFYQSRMDLIFIATLPIIFLPFETLDLYFQSKIENRFTAYSRFPHL